MWISHRYNMCPHRHKPPQLPPHRNPLGCPRALTLDALLHALNSNWSCFTSGNIHVSVRSLFIWLWAGDLYSSRIMSTSTSVKPWLSHSHCSIAFQILAFCIPWSFASVFFISSLCRSLNRHSVSRRKSSGHGVQCRNVLLPDLFAEPNT